MGDIPLSQQLTGYLPWCSDQTDNWHYSVFTKSWFAAEGCGFGLVNTYCLTHFKCQIVVSVYKTC